VNYSVEGSENAKADTHVKFVGQSTGVALEVRIWLLGLMDSCAKGTLGEAEFPQR